MKKKNIVSISLTPIGILLILILLLSGCTSIKTSITTNSSSNISKNETEIPHPEPKTFQDDNFRYVIHYDTESVTIAKCLQDKFALFRITIPEEVEGYPVTEIGDRAFYEFYKLDTISLPETITTIGEAAFGGCVKLRELNLPESMEFIKKEAFVNCESLKSISIPSGITSISDEAVFYGCTGITNFIVDERNTNYISVDGVLFSKDMTQILNYPPARDNTSYTIPEGVIRISNDAFSSCTNLIQITIPDSVKVIGDWAFYNCKKISSITLPDSATSIGNSTFQECSDLFQITLPKKLTKISEQCFARCASLNEVVIPHSVTEIGDKAFYECKALNWIFIPSSVEIIGNSVFVASHTVNGIYCGASAKPENWPEHWSGSAENKFYWGESAEMSKMLKNFLSLAISYYNRELYGNVIHSTRFLIYFTDRMELKDIAMLHALRVDAFNSLEDYVSSLESLDMLIQFLESNPEYQEEYVLSDILLQRGNLLKLSGNHDQAIEAYLSYLKLVPDDFTMYKSIIDYYYIENNDIEGVTFILDTALENYPSWETYVFRLSYFENLELYEQVIEDCTNALEIGTNTYYFYNLRAYYRMLTGYFNEALEDVTSAIMTSPEQYFELYNLRADIYSNLGDYENAVNDYLSVLDITKENPDNGFDPVVYGKIGMAYLELDNPLHAITYFFDYYSRVPREKLEIAYIIAMGDAFYQFGNLESAVISYAAGIALSPELPILYKKTGDILMEQEDYPSALECYRTMLNLVKDDPEQTEMKDYAEQVIRKLEEK